MAKTPNKKPVLNNGKRRLYVVCVDGSYIRDAQVLDACGLSDEQWEKLVETDAFYDDARWTDTRVSAFVDCVFASSEEEACREAAIRYCGYSPHTLIAFPAEDPHAHGNGQLTLEERL